MNESANAKYILFVDNQSEVSRELLEKIDRIRNEVYVVDVSDPEFGCLYDFIRKFSPTKYKIPLLFSARDLRVVDDIHEEISKILGKEVLNES